MQERRFAVGQIELPDAHEAGVEAEGAHRALVARELGPPASERLGVVEAEGEPAFYREAGATCLASKAEMLGSSPPGKMYC